MFGEVKVRSISTIALLAVIAAVALPARRSLASIISHSVSNGNQTASDDSAAWDGWDSNTSEYNMGVSGDDYGGTSQLNGSFLTNSDTDPSIFVTNSFTNSTSFAWTSYDLSVYMPNIFTLTGVAATTPATWSPTSNSGVYYNGSQYEDDVVFSGSPPINVGSNFDFQYTLSFNNQMSYQFTELLTPVPEPTSLGIVVLLAAGFGFSRRLFRTMA
jgi:hypothetical protein